MQQPIHLTAQPGARWSNERVVGVGFVVLLHIVAIWAILNGLVQKVIPNVIPPDLVLTFPHKEQPPPPPTHATPHVDPADLFRTPVAVPPPTLTIENPKQPIGGTENPPQPQPQPIADTYVAGISGTHTIPAYPPLARRLGEQGSVRLSLTISATGDVTGANVVQSSGFADLDRTAVDWVLAHWKYKPATHDGVAVPGQSVAIVVFNLQNAR